MQKASCIEEQQSAILDNMVQCSSEIQQEHPIQPELPVQQSHGVAGTSRAARSAALYQRATCAHQLQSSLPHRISWRCICTIVSLILLVASQPAAAWRDTVLDLGPGVYNPSLVVYKGEVGDVYKVLTAAGAGHFAWPLLQDSAWVVARSTNLKWDTQGLKWIVNKAQFCNINVTNWSTISCHSFDPWKGRYGEQCRWGSDDWKVPWEAWGVDDTKLFLWPGRGLWAITGRRPQRGPEGKYCPQVIWRQWLVQLAADGSQPDPQAFHFPATDRITGVTWAQTDSKYDQSPASGSTLLRQILGTSQTSVGPQGNFLANVGRSLLPQVFGDVMQGSAGWGTGAESRPAAGNAQGSVARFTEPQAAVEAGTGAAALRRLGAHAPSPAESSTLSRQERQSRRQNRYRVKRRKRPQHRRPVRTDQAAFSVTIGITTDAVDLPVPAPAPLPSPIDSSAWDALHSAQPVPLHITDAAAVYGNNYAISEKNWMPFTHEEQLYVTYSVAPKHKVYQLHPTGAAEPKYETDTSGVFAHLGLEASSKMHGGPPMVLLDPQTLAGAAATAGDTFSSSSEAFYLGVVHYWEPAEGSDNKDGRVYHHYLIMTEARPPFSIIKVSKELPLRYNEHFKKVAFVSGLDLALLPPLAAADTQGATLSLESSAAGNEVPETEDAAPENLADSLPPRALLSVHTVSASGRTAGRQRGKLAQLAGRRRLHEDPQELLAGTGVEEVNPQATAQPDAHSDSTGDLLADAESDDFTWDVVRRPPDVNMFSWVAQQDVPAKTASSDGGSPHMFVSQGDTAPASSTSSFADADDLTSGPFANLSSTSGGMAVMPEPKMEQQALLPDDPTDLQLGGLLEHSSDTQAAVPQDWTSHVVISYGSGDYESRVAVLSLQDVDSLFQ